MLSDSFLFPACLFNAILFLPFILLLNLFLLNVCPSHLLFLRKKDIKSKTSLPASRYTSQSRDKEICLEKLFEIITIGKLEVSAPLGLFKLSKLFL